ncbi:SacI homology domain-containing protein [Aspergillus avenaceus]|uniref:phosphoinositide 5-phosphatase n=1 Tax=Aspergillus avenaceus TaxID=36643 RepID=A0A5N6TNH0_ASPAV|nr:SacI homology domain-containing protein [Aspergillus avenaceus]
MPSLRVLSKDYPQRTVALATTHFTLIFRYGSIEREANRHGNGNLRCLVEFAGEDNADLKDYRVLSNGHGTLGLITLGEEVFICVVTAFSSAATVRPGETISRIDNVDFFCLNHSDYEDPLVYESEFSFAAEEHNHGSSFENKDIVTDHPFLALKKLLSDGSFYYSLDFDLTDRLQNRSDKSTAFDIESLNQDMLWNSYMIHPLLLFRDHLSPSEKSHLDSSQIFTCVIRGFSGTLTIPASVSILPQLQSSHPSLLTVISRQSSRRAGTRFNSRGIDDDGNVANFVESETVLWIPPDITFSYAQVRGSVPIFWEQAPGFLPGQQKIEVTRSSEASRHAFNKHFEHLELEYGAIHVVNLLSNLKQGEAELSAEFMKQTRGSCLSQKAGSKLLSDHALLRTTEFDIHAEARGPLGYAASSQIKDEISHPLHGFAYFLSQGADAESLGENQTEPKGSAIILQQEGVFRTNCLDCLDRTNLVQTIISYMALESFVLQQKGKLSYEVQLRHSTLWADNGDALSKIYAGTGALKSSFTRHGKMSIAGALADARKTATRLYVNNFTDKARQKTIDLLLGRLMDQSPVHFHDPINDMVSGELDRRASEYSSTKSIGIWAGTFNVNGSHRGPKIDLTPWLLPCLDGSNEDPVVFAVGFQEIVTLSPQQIMSTDPTTRKVWELAVENSLNNRAKSKGTPKYVLLRSGQLVGSAIMVYVREDTLKDIKHVEGNVKKTGLSGMAGNKGGCAIRFEYCNTRICFVTAHLAAGFANYDERNRDYETICHGLRFQRNRSIDDHDAIIWLGDFNYRIGLSNHAVRELAFQRDFEKLYENDQLNLQMLAGRAFQFFTEGRIAFPPTYKYDIGKDNYDTSEKARIPAWCDRILWRGSCLRHGGYNAANIQFSDHRPVWATFSCIISVVDETMKGSLRRSLYRERKNDPYNVLSITATPEPEELVPKSIAPGLPPASSDHRKWWLENETPVKSTVRLPDNEHILDVHHGSNPFSFNDGADWVDTRYLIKDQTYTDGYGYVSRTPSLPPRVKTESLIYPEAISQEPSSVGITEAQDVNRTTTRPLDDGKMAPPIPRKPVSLTSKQIGKESILDKITPYTGTANSHTSGLVEQGLNVESSRFQDAACGRGWERSANIESTNMESHRGSIDRNDGLLDGVVGETISWKPLMPR